MKFRCLLCHELYDEVEDHPSFDTMPVANGVCVPCAAEENLIDPRRTHEG